MLAGYTYSKFSVMRANITGNHFANILSVGRRVALALFSRFRMRRFEWHIEFREHVKSQGAKLGEHSGECWGKNCITEIAMTQNPVIRQKNCYSIVTHYFLRHVSEIKRSFAHKNMNFILTRTYLRVI
jgi:hypothetical protein